MQNQTKNRKSHKTDALMRLLMSGSSDAVNPSVSITFKEDIIRPINDKKNAPKFSAEPRMSVAEPRTSVTEPRMSAPEPRIEPRQTHQIVPPEMPRQIQPPPQIAPQFSRSAPEPARPEIPTVKINSDHPTELDIVRELTKELLPTAIQRFNVCYCDTCYSAMTEAVAKRSPKITVMVRSKDDLARAEYLKKQNRNNVLRTVIKEVLDYKATGRHNNTVLK
jgi:hypothetical protein